MKAKDFIAALEYTRAFKEPRVKYRREKSESFVDLLLQGKKANDEWNKFLEDIQKINKKDEKKEDKGWWDKMSFMQKMTIVTAFAPVVFLSEMLLAVIVFKAGANILGLR